jgi:DDB1- and CUL4-associated factor 7
MARSRPRSWEDCSRKLFGRPSSLCKKSEPMSHRNQSHIADLTLQIQILDTQITPASPQQAATSPFTITYSRVAEATCSYPVTRILWEPPSSSKTSTDLLATSGDHLRLWSLPSSVSQSPHPQSNTISRNASVNTRTPPPAKLTPLALLSNSKTPEHTAPLTSLDWNTLSPKLIITSSIDTTCTIWDIPTLTAKTQLIAHDKEVYDVRFCAGSVDVFVSCGADGSVRMFDLRSLEHSTIIYEPSDKVDQSTASLGKGKLIYRVTIQTMLVFLLIAYYQIHHLRRLNLALPFLLHCFVSRLRLMILIYSQPLQTIAISFVS